MEREVIRLEEIKSKNVVALIRHHVKDVLKFQAVLNSRLRKLNLNNLHTVITKSYQENYTSTTEYNVYICMPYIKEKEFDSIRFLANEPYWPEYSINFKISITALTVEDIVRTLETNVIVTSNGMKKIEYKENCLSIVSLENLYNSEKIVDEQYEKWQEKQKIKDMISKIEVSNESFDFAMSLM